MMKGANSFFSGLFWLAFSLLICIEASRLQLGDVHQPGPGFFPFWTGVLMGIFSLGILWQWKSRRGDEEKRSDAGGAIGWNIVIVLGALLVYVLSLEKIGFLLNTFWFIGLMLKVIYPQTWRMAILGAAITAILASFVFNVLLKAQIPSGILGF